MKGTYLIRAFGIAPLLMCLVLVGCGSSSKTSSGGLGTPTARSGVSGLRTLVARHRTEALTSMAQAQQSGAASDATVVERAYATLTAIAHTVPPSPRPRPTPAVPTATVAHSEVAAAAPSPTPLPKRSPSLPAPRRITIDGELYHATTLVHCCVAGQGARSMESGIFTVRGRWAISWATVCNQADNAMVLIQVLRHGRPGAAVVIREAEPVGPHYGVRVLSPVGTLMVRATSNCRSWAVNLLLPDGTIPPPTPRPTTTRGTPKRVTGLLSSGARQAAVRAIHSLDDAGIHARAAIIDLDPSQGTISSSQSADARANLDRLRADVAAADRESSGVRDDVNLNRNLKSAAADYEAIDARLRSVVQALSSGNLAEAVTGVSVCNGLLRAANTEILDARSVLTKTRL